MMEPKIRFKGFEGEWKEVKLGDIAKFSKGQGYSKSDLKETGHPIILYGRMYTKYRFAIDEVDTFANLKDSSILSEGNEIIMPSSGETPEDIACASAVLAKEIILGGDLNIMHFDLTKFSTSYIALVITYGKTHHDLSKCAQGKSVVHLHNGAISKAIITLPSLAEQQAIASYFTFLDSHISASTSRLASLKQMKAASLQAMFPQEGETVPKIRFKGFEGEWKKVKLSEILTERHENSTITDSLPQLSFTIADGVIRPEDRKSNKRDFLIKDIDNKRYLVTKVGDIIYNPANVVYGAIHRNSLMNGVVSPIYKIFTTMQDSNFIECAVRRPSFITKLAMCTEGTVTKLKTLKPEAFLNMEVCITPSLEEQKLIGNYFTSLDRQISLQSQRLEKLKQIKSACLDKMFV